MIPDWDAKRALVALAIDQIPFDSTDGNCQGFARKRQIAINPVAQLPHKTLFHELAHVVIGHTAEADFADTEKTPRNLREVEAESAALLCCEALGLKGADYARGNIQHWLYQGVGYDADAEPSLLDALDQEGSLYSIVQLALNTGMRRVEILSLKWSEVDLNRGLICVTQTKTNRNRIIPMNQVVRELLSQQQGQGEYVFTSPRTKGCLVEIKKGFKKACQVAGIQDFHFHDLRHTAASRLTATGADIVTIAEILGHSSFRMTKRYTHASEERKRNALESMVSKNVVTTWSQNQKGKVAALP